MDNRKAVLKIGGMTCVSCARTIEKSLKKTKGVLSAEISFAAEKATVVYNPAAAGYPALKKAVESAGYSVIDEESRAGEEAQSMQRARRKMLMSWLFTVPIIIWMLPEMITHTAWPDRITFDLGMIFLAAPVVFIWGADTLRSGVKSLMTLAPNMDALIGIGTSVSFITGAGSLFLPVANYAGISAMIMAFHLTGRYVEAKARGRASEAITKLLELGAKTARVLDKGKEKEIPVEDLKPGDIMIVKPGEKIPTDGTVVEGSTAVDESMATGESMPAARGPGDEVIGATINQQGLIKVKAEKTGRDTFLSQVIKMVEECQSTRVPIQEFADRITRYFVPVILLVSLATFLSWLVFPDFFHRIILRAEIYIPWVDSGLTTFSLAIFAAVAVLVIACPCALGLATPTALMVGSGMGAEKGILIREGAAIQALKDVREIVFDKTGTLTAGKPAVTDILPEKGWAEEELLRLSASAESGSEHPVASAVVNLAGERNISIGEPSDFEAFPGRGIKAKTLGRNILIGTRALMKEIKISPETEGRLKKLEEDAKTAMLVSVDGKIAGIIAVADTIKEGAYETIDQLEKMGIRTAMLTGDNRRTAEAIAGKLGITRVLHDVLPGEKVDEIKRLQREFGIIAMVGDGINDAPALTQADVGIAIGTGTDIAIEASDITLVGESLHGVLRAINLSQATFKKIRQNLFWAYGYNTVAIPIAVFGLLHPVIAEIAMAASSISVVTNANLLRRAKID